MGCHGPLFSLDSPFRELSLQIHCSWTLDYFTIVMCTQGMCVTLFLWLQFAFHFSALFLLCFVFHLDRWNRSTDFLSAERFAETVFSLGLVLGWYPCWLLALCCVQSSRDAYVPGFGSRPLLTLFPSRLGSRSL